MNKVLSKIVSIISFVFAIMYFIVFVSFHFLVSYDYFVNNIHYYIVLLLMGIGAFVSACAGFAFNDYKDLSMEKLKEKKNAILIWSAIFIFSCTACSILTLLLYIGLFYDFSNTKTQDYVDEIYELEKIKEKGIITEKEFKAKKKKLLNI